MALKPQIFKLRVSLSDMNRDYYDSLNLTVAQHPSETTERMMARVLAFCLHASESLIFCKGLSDTDEPDLWDISLSGDTELWIEVGEPGADRIKKATRMAKKVIVYCFNSKADTWWRQEEAKLTASKASFFQLPWPAMQALAEKVERTMELSVSITGDSLYVATEKGEVDISLTTLKDLV